MKLQIDLRSEIVRMEGENALLHMSLEQALCQARRRQSFSSRLVAILLVVILFFVCVSAWSGVPYRLLDLCICHVDGHKLCRS